jgi:CubicO group peptidase (beta-lactamase class C family)
LRVGSLEPLTEVGMRPQRRILTSAWAALVLAGCAGGPSIAAPEPCAAPHADLDWPVAAPEAADFDIPALCAALREAAGTAANIHGVLVERRGRLVAEFYRRGTDRPISMLYGLWPPIAGTVDFDAVTLHDVRSVSKSVVGLLFGIEAAKGETPGPGARVLDSYPELKDLRGGGRESIRFEDVLTMSGGLDWAEWGRGVLTSDETRLYWKSEPVRFVFDRAMAAAPGTKFEYNGGGTTVLADTLARSTGKPLLEVARQDLFEPLGITRWEWVADLHGRPLAFSGLRLLPRDMLKIGRMMNDHGRWHGRQVVPESWVAESMRSHIATGVDLFALANERVGYGYQWWTGRAGLQNREVDWAAAIGNGGERILVVPALDLTVVITAGEYGSLQIQRFETRLLAAILMAVRD